MNSKNTIITNISWSFAEKLLTEAVSTVVTIILARLLIPDDYGLVSLVQVFINISSIFVECGLGESLIQNKDSTKEQESTIFYINLFIGLFIYIVLFFAAPYIGEIKNNREIVTLLRVLAIKIPIASIYNIQNSYVKKKLQFKKFFFSSLAGTLLSGIVGVVLAYKGYGAWALVFATLTDQIVDSIILFITTRWFPKFVLSFNKSKAMIAFGGKILVTEFMSRVSTQAKSLIIGLKYSSADLAYDSKGVKFPQAITSMTSSSVIKVMFPVLSDVQDDKEKMRELVSKCIQMCFYLLAPLMIGFMAIADNFILLLLTDKWVGCIPYIRIYCLAYLLNVISAVDLRLISASNNADVLVKLRIKDISFGLLMILLAVSMFHSAIYLAYATLIGQIFNIFVEMIETKKIVNYGIKEHLRDMLPTLFVSLIMGITVYCVGMILPYGKILTVTIEVFVGILVYVVLSILLKLKPFNDLIGHIKNLSNRH